MPIQSEKQKLLITVSSTRVIRFLIKTPLFEALKEQYEVVFLSDLPLEKMGASGITQISVPKQRFFWGGIKAGLHYFISRYCAKKHHKKLQEGYGLIGEEILLYNLNDVAPIFRSPRGIVGLRLADTIVGFFIDICLYFVSLQTILWMIYRDGALMEVIKTINPCAVMLTTPNHKTDIRMGVIASKLECPCLVYPEGFDYIFRPVFFDYAGIFSWGPSFEKDLMRMGVPLEKQIRIENPLKSLQNYATPELIAIKKEWGIPETNKIVTLYGNATYITGIEHQRHMVKLVLKWAKGYPNLSVVLRALPYDNQWADLEWLYMQEAENPQFKVRQASAAFFDFSKSGNTTDPNLEVVEWASVTDVLVTIISHSVLEYGMRGKPAVVYNFIGYPGLSKKYHFYLMQDFIRSQIYFVETEDSFCRAITEALEKKFQPEKMIEIFSFRTDTSQVLKEITRKIELRMS